MLSWFENLAQLERACEWQGAGGKAVGVKLSWLLYAGGKLVISGGGAVIIVVVIGSSSSAFPAKTSS